MLVTTHLRTLRFTRHYKDTIQERLTILISFCYKFIGVHVCQKLPKKTVVWQSYCKNKMVQFFYFGFKLWTLVYQSTSQTQPVGPKLKSETAPMYCLKFISGWLNKRSGCDVQCIIKILFKRDWRFWYQFVPKLLEYTCAKNYQYGAWFDRVIAKIKWCSFLTRSVHLLYNK